MLPAAVVEGHPQRLLHLLLFVMRRSIVHLRNNLFTGTIPSTLSAWTALTCVTLLALCAPLPRHVRVDFAGSWTCQQTALSARSMTSRSHRPLCGKQALFGTRVKHVHVVLNHDLVVRQLLGFQLESAQWNDLKRAVSNFSFVRLAFC
jgi:hypothetical protein